VCQSGGDGWRTARQEVWGAVSKVRPQGLSVKRYVFLSGSHWVVSVGQSRAVLRIRSYRYGEFFFHILYSGSWSASCVDERLEELAFIDYLVLQLLFFLGLCIAHYEKTKLVAEG
jgi:hypothetical protein